MVVPMSGGQTEKQVQLIRDFEPRIIMVTPSYMLNLLDEMARQGMDPAESSLKIGIFGAEPWTRACAAKSTTRRASMRSIFTGCRKSWGRALRASASKARMARSSGKITFYPEIIDPVTGEVLPDGSPGELVFTSLSKEAMPIIRYRTRDLTSLLPPTSRSMRRLAKITGRSDDMLIIRGVNVFPSQIEELILAMPKPERAVSADVTREGHLDSLGVPSKLGPKSARRLAMAIGQALARELQHRIKTMVGVSTAVSILRTGEIPATATGKAKRVVDLRNAPKSAS